MSVLGDRKMYVGVKELMPDPKKPGTLKWINIARTNCDSLEGIPGSADAFVEKFNSSSRIEAQIESYKERIAKLEARKGTVE